MHLPACNEGWEAKLPVKSTLRLNPVPRTSVTRCWLHIGMPKTGTSSIQETLYYELIDPGFVYCGFGEINGSYALSAFVGKSPYIASLRTLGVGADAYRRRMLGRFRRSVKRARDRGADLIL